MNKTFLITIFFVLLVSIDSFAQEGLTAAKVRADVKDSTESLSVTLLLPDSDFYIGLTTDQFVENIYMNPCIDIKSNTKKNAKVLDLLEKHQLLDKLFVEIDNQYETPDASTSFEPNESILYLELFLGVKKSVHQVYVPIFSREKAELLISSLKKIYGNKKCFKKLQKMINT